MTHRSFPDRLSRSYTLREAEKPVFRSEREDERRDALLDMAETMMADKGLLQAGLRRSVPVWAWRRMRCALGLTATPCAASPEVLTSLDEEDGASVRDTCGSSCSTTPPIVTR